MTKSPILFVVWNSRELLTQPLERQATFEMKLSKWNFSNGERGFDRLRQHYPPEALPFNPAAIQRTVYRTSVDLPGTNQVDREPPFDLADRISVRSWPTGCLSIRIRSSRIWENTLFTKQNNWSRELSDLLDLLDEQLTGASRRCVYRSRDSAAE